MSEEKFDIYEKTTDIEVKESNDVFRFVNEFECNRNINMKKVEGWIEAFLNQDFHKQFKNNHIKVKPVGGLYYVGDGQHRVTAIQKIYMRDVPAKFKDHPLVGTPLPIYFQIIPNLSVQNVRDMNLLGASWNMRDNITSYGSKHSTDPNHKDIVKLQKFIDKWQISDSIAIELTMDAPSSVRQYCINNGTYEFKCHDLANTIMEHAKQFSPLFDISDGEPKKRPITTSTGFIRMLKQVMMIDGYDQERMVQNINSIIGEKNWPSGTKSGIITLEAIYNLNIKPEDKKYLLFWDKNLNKNVLTLQKKKMNDMLVAKEKAKRKELRDKRKEAEKLAKLKEDSKDIPRDIYGRIIEQ